MDSLLQKYNKINNSFKKEYIFHLGASSGFYSELSNMISAILYCLKYKYKFVLYSKDANFGFNKGWQDYFFSFTKETNFFIHRLYNKRNIQPKIRKRHYLLWNVYRKLFKNTVLTYELWDKYFCKEFDKEFFDIPLLEIHGDLRVASAKIVSMIYRFNDELKNQINFCINNLSLPSDYISMQIRKGDKITECSLCPVEEYFKKAESITAIRNVFLLTDDYSVIDEVKHKYPNWNIFNLVESSEHGYFHKEFLQLSKSVKKEKLTKLLTSIEIIRNSHLFIGTYTANVGLFLGMAMPFSKVVSIQRKEWFRFSNEDIMEQLAPQWRI